MDNNRPTRSRFRTIRLVVAMALGALAVLALPSIAAAKDRNHDRIPDRWEKRHHLSLKVKQTRRDQDGDKLRNLGEFNNQTNPRDADTDNDGLDDGDEVEVGDDPADEDSDDDGVADGDENAGTVASFDGTTLTINLAAGGSVSGLVTDGTEIKCESSDDDGDGEEHSGHEGSGHHPDRATAHDEGGDQQSGDDGDEEHGDDDGENGDGEHGDEGGDACSSDDLVEGATVHEADLHVGGDGAVFEEVELVK